MAQSHYKKIRQIFDKTTTNEDNIEKLKEVRIKTLSINYSKNKKEYTTDWLQIGVSWDGYISIELKDFPEEFISNLKVVGIFKTSDGLISTDNYLNCIPKWYYIIREYENKYVLEIFVDIYSIIYGMFFKTNIIVINPGDAYEIRTRKE